MCGILGFAVASAKNISQDSALKAIQQLFLLSETRGQEVSGIALQSPTTIHIEREPCPAHMLVKTPRFQAAFQAAFCQAQSADSHFAAIGHTRFATNGLQAVENNNQPVVSGPVILVQNGLVVNASELWREIHSVEKRTEADSEVLAALLADCLHAEQSLETAVCHAFRLIEGENSVAALFADSNMLLLASNTGSIFTRYNADAATLLFVSERSSAHALAKDTDCTGCLTKQFMQVKAGTALLIDLRTLESRHIALGADTPVEAPFIAPMLATQRRIETRWQREEEARASLRRCTRCLLPESMPFIKYDANGECNYCRHYTPMLSAGREALEAALAPHRRENGETDCLVAFSGGRDSSYGMHLLKREFGMTPLAYTYDWGMITDLGRRNQARMCGALAVEHLGVSADIKKQRAYIRANVDAWLKKPDMGIIPLFMAGDKLFFRRANDSMKRYQIPLMVFCSNKLEKTDFKTGFCGVPPLHNVNQPFSLSLGRKIKMMTYYARQFLNNPAYINTSIVNTLQCYFSYYFQEGKYLFLYDYIPWEENTIDTTLINKYGWETAQDTKSTWRIGDATAPFYNYIYYTVAGFTEFDTFRSNQIREGQIDRQTALASVQEENQPRWGALREYAQMISVDFGAIIKAVGAMPRLYAL